MEKPTLEAMTRQQFCDGIRLLGGKTAAADALDMNPRTIERIMKGSSDLGDSLSARLANALDDRKGSIANLLAEISI